MASSIDNFRQGFVPIHSNRFKVIGNIPNVKDLNKNDGPFEFYVKAAQLPGSSVGVVGMNYRGRKINVPAERAYSDWAFTFYSSDKKDKDFRILFENWLEAINSWNNLVQNYKLVSNWWIKYAETNNADYKRQIGIYNCFPNDISTAELSNDVSDAFLEFTVSMSYDYYYIRTIESVDDKQSTQSPSDFRI